MTRTREEIEKELAPFKQEGSVYNGQLTVAERHIIELLLDIRSAVSPAIRELENATTNSTFMQVDDTNKVVNPEEK